MSIPSVWSCGGGTQSVAIAALIIQGRLERPDYAVIADTGMEKSTTWEYFDSVLKPRLDEDGLQIHVAKASEYATVGVFGGKDKKSALIPAFTSVGGSAGKLPNFCSYEWKRRVVERFMRAQGVTHYTSWIGFSLEESKRVKSAMNSPRPQRYPLIELGITRDQCMAIVQKMGWPTPPRSSCWMCPNQGDREWREVQKSKDWQKVVAFDEAIREVDPDLWLTSDMKPISEIDFSDRNGDLLGCESGECFV